MIISASRNSEDFMASAATSSGNGSKGLASELSLVSQQSKPSMNDTLPSGQARNRGHITTFGTPRRRPPCSMGCAIHGPFNVQSNGGIGQTICDADGNAIAWTTDVFVAQVICRLMNDYTNNHQEGL